MPPKRNRAAVLREWIAKIDGNSVYTTDGRVIFCEPCQQQAPSDQFFQFKQHNQTSKHQKNLQRLRSIKTIVNSFDAKDARCIEESQACFIDSTWRNLAYIQSNYINPFLLIIE
uniref:Uncharacterized protein n=1 Tax=Meloidogyne incognita TaxID=6306 RepID=A0A914N9N8_MELIC